MKKWVFAAAILMVLTVGAQVAGDHYRYAFYEWAVDFEQDKAGLQAKTFSLSGETYAYLEGPRQEGKQTVLMLHGFGASKENWVRFAAELENNYHLVALDLAGHGDNPQNMGASYTVEAQVEFVKQAMETLEVETFHLVGNSMGGAIASLYAASYPKQVLSATLISPAGVHDVPSKMDELLEQGKNPLIAHSIPEFLELLDFVMEDQPYIPAPIAKVEAEKAVSRAEMNQKIFTDLRADLEKGLEQKLTQIQAPVLIIWGAQDRAINVANIDKYARLIPESEKLVMEDVGHLAMIERPGQSASAMMRFLDQPAG